MATLHLHWISIYIFNRRKKTQDTKENRTGQTRVLFQTNIIFISRYGICFFFTVKIRTKSNQPSTSTFRLDSRGRRRWERGGQERKTIFEKKKKTLTTLQKKQGRGAREGGEEGSITTIRTTDLYTLSLCDANGQSHTTAYYITSHGQVGTFFLILYKVKNI